MKTKSSKYVRSWSYRYNQTKYATAGFTLVEMMVAVALSGFVIAAIYMSFRGQEKASQTQDNIVSIQQNLRAAFSIMSDEIRTAGYDPTGSSGAKIISATANSIRFSMDLDGDGTTTSSGEDITYDLYPSNGITELGRKAPTTNSAVAEYIDYLGFYYTLKDGSQTSSPTNPDDIRTVQIAILGRSRAISPDYTNNIVYLTPWGVNMADGSTSTTVKFSDNYQRRYLIATVNCRNMGL